MPSLSLILLLLCAVALAQDVTFAPVVSASIEQLEVKPERKAVQFQVRNVGSKPITAFMASLSVLGSDGKEMRCNAGGMDMIDWSDPMPGTNLIVKPRRQWIEPNQTFRSERYFMNCLDRGGSAETARVELINIMFDDGSGEGNPRELASFLRTRQQLRNERVKWTSRFAQLRSAEDLHAAATQLYRDLLTAKHETEANPDVAGANAMVRSCLEDLQRVALNLVQYGKFHARLDPGSREAWFITDLEQRTARLVRGAGPEDAPLDQP